MTGKLLFFTSVFLFAGSLVFSQDVFIDTNGNVGIGTNTPTARVEAVGSVNSEAIVGTGSGTGSGVYGENVTSGNYGVLGNTYHGVYGYSPSGYAGYFQGNARVTGDLLIDGIISGSGIGDITSLMPGPGLTGGGESGDIILKINFAGPGSAVTVSHSDHNHLQADIDYLITRDNEVMPIVLANGGAGSGIDADTLDGKNSSAFASAVAVNELQDRVAVLEGQESAASITGAAEEGAAELKIWIKAAQKAWTSLGGIAEVDADGDGVIEAGETNFMLASAGVVTQFIVREAIKNGGISLWVNGGATYNLWACNNQATSNPGKITVCYSPVEDHTIEYVFVSATDYDGNLVYQETVSGYTDGERRESLIASAGEGAAELKTWIKAVQKAGTLQGSVREFDTDGNGIIGANDLTNDQLSSVGVVREFIYYSERNNKSPWDGRRPLWTDGGFSSSQMGCDNVATGMPGRITLCYTPNEDNTVEYVFISATDNNGNLVYQETVSGHTDGERRDLLIASAVEGAVELGTWIKAVQKAGWTLQGWIAEIDADGDGVIEPDETNIMLSAAGVVTMFIVSKEDQRSPWDGRDRLWTNGGVVSSQQVCDNTAKFMPGQITLCYSPSEDHMVENVFIAATEHDGNLVYRKTVSGYTDGERRASIIAAAGEGGPELKAWIRAARKAGTPEGALVEVDTNGDGVVGLNDLNNEQLASDGVVTTFVARSGNRYEGSPWNGFSPLWVNGGVKVNQWACDEAAMGYPGQITVCFAPVENDLIEYMFISASDYRGNLVYWKTVNGN